MTFCGAEYSHAMSLSTHLWERRQNSKRFRSWLDEVGADFELLPEDAFTGVEAFRQTRVRTRVVVLDKPSP